LGCYHARRERYAHGIFVLTELFSTYSQHFSYAGLFVVLILCGFGLPVPEDLALLVGGFMVYRGTTGYPMTLAVALVGVIAGDNSLYLLGRRFGTGLVKYLQLVRPNSQRQIDWLKDLMRRHGHLAIFYVRFLAGARALVYVSAGSLGVEFGRFFLYDLLGAVISVPLVVTIGYLCGPQIEIVASYAGGFERIVWAVLIALALYLVARTLVLRRTNHAA
jgi:membrane protein DedA with SNARE-associated domain